MIAVRRLFVILLVWSLSVPAGVPLRALTTLGSGEGGQRPAPGQPYSGDCAQAIPAAERLQKGLASHEDAMRRAQALIASAKGGTAPAGLGARSVDAAKSVTEELLKTCDALRQKIAALKLGGSASDSGARILKSLDNIGTLSIGVDALLAAGKYKQAMDDVTNMRQLAETTGTYLMDSRIGDMLAAEAGASLLTGTVGASLAGPAGVLIVQVAALGIEVGANAIQADIEANDVRQAQDTLDAVKFQKGLIEDRITSLVDFCRPTPKPETKQNAPAKEPAGKGKLAGSGGKSGNAGKIAVLAAGAAGAAVAVGYAAKLAKQNASESGCDTSKAPINEINAACFGSTRNTSLCNQYIAQYDSFCKSCGYSRFDTGVGGCR
jgi:hypothetical protein